MLRPEPGAADQRFEQVEYLEGVLWSDRAYRIDGNAEDIDPYGNGTAAFWRGLIEAGGYVAMGTNGERPYPRVDLRANHGVLTKFLAFMDDELRPTIAQILAGGRVFRARWDADGKLAFQAGSGKLRISGQKAQDVCRVLYPPDSVIGLESVRAVVDQIIAWTPRG